jgi:hypothetical protein
MIATAIILTLVGALLVGRTVSYSAPTSDVGSSGNTGPSGVPGSLLEARDAFEQAVSNNYGDSNLEVVDVMEFANNYYAEVRESDTGIGAMELLIDKHSGRVFPEPGPNMMWNTKYGMMSGRGGMMALDGNGMMGPGGQGMMGPNGGPNQQPYQAGPGDQMTITPAQANQIADEYINRNSLGDETEEPDQFYGYYTLHIKDQGEVAGMLSVNGYTGQVWYHSWHGPFIAMEEEAE